MIGIHDRVAVEEVDGIISVVHLSGVPDDASIQAVEAAVLGATGPGRVVVDLTAATRVDGELVRRLTELRSRAEAARGMLVLVCAPRSPAAVALQFVDRLPIYPTREEGVRSFWEVSDYD
jgi:anti-anti-sigma regulatory factor